MRRVVGMAWVVLALATTAHAQTPAPPAVPAIPWDEAEITWTPPAEYLNGGGSLASCATGPCGVLYIVEAATSPGPGWGPVAIVDGTHYRATDLRPGVWQFRVRAFFKGSGYSPPGPVVTKTITEPVAAAPPVTAVQ